MVLGTSPPMIALGWTVLGGWLGLCVGRAWFWRIEREATPPDPDAWPDVIAVIPARNEEAVIAESLRSLWEQDYPGRLRVVVVDDRSEDRTADAARVALSESGWRGDLALLQAGPLPPGWVGKVWAMQQGLARGDVAADPARYVLFCDADIAHGRGALRDLVARAEAGPCDLVSYMVRLQCRTAAERLLIPAFVYFFRLLYPFRRVNDPSDAMAGAAGGTMLVRRAALDRIGGLASIRGALIDDCALARLVKQGGHRIWLGMSRESRSLRGYGSVDEIVTMIARSAYTQLAHSPLTLLGCLAGLSLIFLAPPIVVAFGGPSAALAGAAWVLMFASYLPMVRFYGQSPLWAAVLPLAACLYLWATVLSAWSYHRGRGSQWKGRPAF